MCMTLAGPLLRPILEIQAYPKTEASDAASEQTAALPAHIMEGLRAKLAVIEATPMLAQDTRRENSHQRQREVQQFCGMEACWAISSKQKARPFPDRA